MKIFLRNIHLYLGLAAGIFIAIACATGAILVFEEEIQHSIHHGRYYNLNNGSAPLPVDELQKLVAAKVGKAEISGVRIFADPSRNYEFSIRKDAGGKEGLRLIAFIDPYSGKLIEIYNHRESFMYDVMDLHRWLLGGQTGKLIMGISTLIFLFILLTGILLWWPRNRAILKQRFRLKTDAGWKRVNHDLHIVLGFYSSIILFVFAFTALAWSFQWFNDGIYSITGSSRKPIPPPESDWRNGVRVSTEFIYLASKKNIPDAKYYNINFPKDSTGIFTVNSLSRNAAHETASDTYYFDQFTGQLKKTVYFKDKSLGQRVRSTFRPVHTSSILGVPGKIIGLLVCILGTSFPITGIILWINRLRKQSRVA